MGTSLSGWICSNAAVRCLYLRSLHGVNTSTTPFSRSIRYRLRTPTTSISITFVTGGFFSALDSLSCLSPSVFASMKADPDENAGNRP